MRKMIGMVVVGIMAAAFFAAASPAGAQTTTVQQSCIFTVAPTTFSPGTIFPQNVTVSGSAAPDGATVTVFLNGTATTPTTTVVSGAFSVVISIPASGTIVSVGLTATYAGTCATAQGLPSVLVSAEAEAAQVIRPAAAAALAFTGSNDTPSYVLVGIAALVLGAVFVVAARRRSQVS